jgi:cohesin domain-containing protein
VSPFRLGQATAARATFLLIAVLVLTDVPPATRSAEANHSASSIDLLAIDAQPEGNVATALGPLDGCSSAAVGGLVTVDFIVADVPQDRPLIGFEAEIHYDRRLLEVVSVQSDLLLAAEGEFEPFIGLSDPLPDRDSVYRISVLDTASVTSPEANVERGPGVLARLTFRTLAKGVSRISIGYNLRGDFLLYPLNLDTQNEVIQIDHLGSAAVVSGKECPAGFNSPRIRPLPSIAQIEGGF